MSLTGEECRHEFWTSYEPASDNSSGKPENECWERCYPYSWKSGLYLHFAEERSAVFFMDVSKFYHGDYYLEELKTIEGK